MDVYEYIKSHSTAQDKALEWVERQTNLRTNHSRMLSGAVQGRFLMMLMDMIRPLRVLELGTFTGYSAICLASRLPKNGHLDTLELNDELEDLILEGFERAGVQNKVDLIIGDCKKTLEKMRDEGEGLYDLVYIDANKREYVEYYNLVFDLVRPGGYILADNVLWDGKVYEDELAGDKQTRGIAAFNELVAKDKRVENVILPLRDGLNLIRRLI